MKVSIITICFNSDKTIQDTIESVLAQDYQNIEYILVDGNSNDKTLDIIRKYEDHIDVVVSEPDKGIYDAMNKGIRLATGDVVGILNSDDFFESTQVIKEVVEKFTSNPNSNLVFGNVLIVDPLNTKRIIRFYNSYKFRVWKLRFGWMPPHPASFIKRSLYDQVGNYSLDYKIAADYELFVRILMKYKISYSRIDKVLVIMRAGGISTSGLKSSYLLNSEIVKACKNNDIYTNLLFVLSKTPFKLLEFFKRPKEHC